MRLYDGNVPVSNYIAYIHVILCAPKCCNRS